jgi:uncharacterized protein (DUF2267 family)
MKHRFWEFIDPERCAFIQVMASYTREALWNANRPVFKEFFTWLVKEQHLTFSNRFPTDIVQDMIVRSHHYDKEYDTQLELIDFFMSVGYEFPSTFYMGTYTFDRPCARLSTPGHARLMDTGMSVSPAWQHAHMPGDAQFIHMVWKMRRDCGLACVALISVLRKKRRDLGMCVNADVLKIIIADIWRHRWDELGLQSSFFLLH